MSGSDARDDSTSVKRPARPLNPGRRQPTGVLLPRQVKIEKNKNLALTLSTLGTSLGSAQATSYSRATPRCVVESGTRRTVEVWATTMVELLPTSWRTRAACTALLMTSSFLQAPAEVTTCRRRKLCRGRRTSRSTLSVWRRRNGCPGCKVLPAATSAPTRSLPRC